MKEFIEYIARKLILKLRVAQPDIGKIIGKKGRTAFALRTLVAAVGKKAGRKVLLEVMD
jgi:hypothetical protein